MFLIAMVFDVIQTSCGLEHKIRSPDSDDGSSKELRQEQIMPERRGLVLIASCCPVIFPLAQMYFYGETDYRRPCDVLVVLGARVNASGHVSWALDERLRTAAEVYKQGLVPRILVSGGPGQGQIHETQAMKIRLGELGVEPSHILMDPAGLDTQDSARNTIKICQLRKWKRVMAVSHFYHLPRIKLAFHRGGMDVFTVPAKRMYRLRFMPYFLLREVAALWFYYFRPLWTITAS